jgi:putative ABC transport system permease protein
MVQILARTSGVKGKRAALTIAAIAWGSLALILLLAFGEGLERQMAESGRGMGRHLAIVWPGETGRPFEGIPAGRELRARTDDVEALRAAIPELDGAIGEMRTWGATYTWGERTINGRLTGTWPEYGELRNNHPQPGGRFLNRRDFDERRRVIFLGDELARSIFGDVPPVGETLLVHQVPYTVVGVMRSKMQSSSYAGPDESNAIVPITTFEAHFGRKTLSNLVLRPRAPELMPRVLRRTHEVLGARLGFHPDDERALGVWDTIESDRMNARIMIGIEIFLGVIGVLTLIVGGVGVANVMFAVVRERTREIGVLIALGARRSWLIWPVVLEGLVYTLVGGLIGLAAGALVVMALRAVPTEGNEALAFLGKPTISLTIAFVATSTLGIIGILAGYFPARRAASVDPAESLRYE